MLKICLISILLVLSSPLLANDFLIDMAHEKGIELSPQDMEVLDNGELSTGRYLVGGILGTYPIGLGVGHAIQGRWVSKGWIFTAGELITGTLLMTTSLDCLSETFLRSDQNEGDQVQCDAAPLITLSAYGYLALRVWEIVDLWRGGHLQQRRYQRLKKKITGDGWGFCFLNSSFLRHKLNSIKLDSC